MQDLRRPTGASSGRWLKPQICTLSLLHQRHSLNQSLVSFRWRQGPCQALWQHTGVSHVWARIRGTRHAQHELWITSQTKTKTKQPKLESLMRIISECCKDISDLTNRAGLTQLPCLQDKRKLLGQMWTNIFSKEFESECFFPFYWSVSVFMPLCQGEQNAGRDGVRTMESKQTSVVFNYHRNKRGAELAWACSCLSLGLYESH